MTSMTIPPKKQIADLIHVLSQKKQITKSSKINYEALNKFWFEIENKEKKSS